MKSQAQCFCEQTVRALKLSSLTFIAFGWIFSGNALALLLELGLAQRV